MANSYHSERCHTDDLTPSILVFSLSPVSVYCEVLGIKISSIILNQVVLERPAGVLQSAGGRSAAK